MKGEGKVGLSHKVNAMETLVPGGPFTDPELLAGRRSYVPPEIVAEVSVERSRRRAARRRGERPGSFESRVEGLQERRRDPRDRVRTVGREEARVPGSRPPGYGRGEESRGPLIDPNVREIERQAERILEQNDRDDGIVTSRDSSTDRTAFETDVRTQTPERTATPERTQTPESTQTPTRTETPERTQSSERTQPPTREDSREETPRR